MKIELRKLAIVDLSVTFARKMSENKIRHYRVSAIQYLTDLVGISPFELVAQHIKDEEGDVEVVLVNNPGAEVSSILSSQDMSGQMKSRKAIEQLGKKRVTSTIHQYSDVVNPSDYEGQYMPFFAKLSYIASLIGLSSLVPEKYKLRRVVAVSYLSYMYEENFEAKAIEALDNDLKILSDRGLILGNLAMPSTVVLADITGSGYVSKAIFCFPVVDTNKLARQLGKNTLEMPRLPLSTIGIASENFEGGIGPRFGTDYEIETVEVGESQYEKNRNAVIENFEANKEHVNSVAMVQKEGLQQFEKVSSRTQDADRGTLAVDVTLRNKATGEEISVNADTYKKNQ